MRPQTTPHAPHPTPHVSHPSALAPDPSPLLVARTTPVHLLKGVGPKAAERLAGLGISTVWDLLLHLPARYEDRATFVPIARLEHGQSAVIRCRVMDELRVERRGRLSLASAPARDATGSVRLVWFNRPWVSQRVRAGMELCVAGRVRRQKGRVDVAVTAWQAASDEARTSVFGVRLPVYSSVVGLRQSSLRRWIARALEDYAQPGYEPVPEAVRRRHGLLQLHEALRAVHAPGSEEEEQRARRSLALMELLALQVGVLRRRAGQRSRRAWPIPAASAYVDEFMGEHGRESILPFRLTSAQRRALGEILADLAQDRPMNRLLHGEVGSGKTAVAAAGLLAVVRGGAQGALLVPTEVLAEQQHRVLCSWLEPLGARILLLIGSLPPAAKREVRTLLASPEPAIVVGTHALLQEGVEFSRLALAVIDEQHRFGVEQRAALVARGMGSVESGEWRVGQESSYPPRSTLHSPHLLLMSATPIPRTLSLTLYGDLDLSVIDELPPGRQPVETLMCPRAAAYRRVRKHVVQGGQAFVICPAIGDQGSGIGDRGSAVGRRRSGMAHLASEVEVVAELRAGVLKGLSVGALHGRMPAPERIEVMDRFVRGETDVLVSTTVVEVGVDVPRAGAIIIEDAERFGLAQLHQLRGRVGRGGQAAFCALISRSRSPQARERLAVLCQSSDGFEIAEADLKFRGPGEWMGTRQSGVPDLRAADLRTDVSLLLTARAEAERLLAADPELARPEHRHLAAEVARWDARASQASEHGWVG